MIKQCSQRDAEILYPVESGPRLSRRLANLVRIDVVLRKELENRYPKLFIPALSIQILSNFDSEKLVEEKGAFNPMRWAGVSQKGEISFSSQASDRQWALFLCNNYGVQIFCYNAPLELQTVDMPYSSYHKALLNTVRSHFDAECRSILQDEKIFSAPWSAMLKTVGSYSLFNRQKKKVESVASLITKLILAPERATFASSFERK